MIPHLLFSGGLLTLGRKGCVENVIDGLAHTSFLFLVKRKGPDHKRRIGALGYISSSLGQNHGNTVLVLDTCAETVAHVVVRDQFLLIFPDVHFWFTMVA